MDKDLNLLLYPDGTVKVDGMNRPILMRQKVAISRCCSGLALKAVPNIL